MWVNRRDLAESTVRQQHLKRIVRNWVRVASPCGSCTGDKMSVTNFCSADAQNASAVSAKVAFQTLQEKKQSGKPISALTAYDYATARLVDEAGVDLILVGDSLAMVVMGHESTLPVTMDEMLHHTRAVRRAVNRALVV